MLRRTSAGLRRNVLERLWIVLGLLALCPLVTSDLVAGDDRLVAEPQSTDDAFTRPRGLGNVSPPAVAPRSISSRLFGIQGDTLVQIDPLTAQTTEIGEVGDHEISGLAYDPFSRTMYGVDARNNNLVTIDLSNAHVTVVGDTGVDRSVETLEGITFDASEKRLYAASSGNYSYSVGKLYQLDMITGQASPIRLLSLHVHALGWDPTSGMAYGLTFDRLPECPRQEHEGAILVGKLVTVDLSTGETSFVACTGWGESLTFDSQGIAYATIRFAVVRPQPGGVLFDLWVLDKETGWQTSVGKIPALEDDIQNCGAGCYSSFVTGMAFETPSTFTISVDITPDSYPNSVNPYSRGVIPVAILGSDTFDVATVDVTTLAFASGGAAPAHRLSDPFTYNDHLQDVNLDGYMDLVTHYPTRQTGIACGDESATLTGELLDGQPFEGTDSISTVGCRNFGQPAIWLKDQERLSQPGSGRVVDVEQD